MKRVNLGVFFSIISQIDHFFGLCFILLIFMESFVEENLSITRVKFFSDICRFFSKIAHDSADTAVNLLKKLTAAILLRKTVIPANILQKAPVFFLLMRKMLTQSRKQKNNKRRWNVLSGPKRKLSYTNVFASQKSVTKTTVTKSSLVQTKQTFGSIISNCICESDNCSTTSTPFFPYNTLSFFFRCFEFFYMKRYRNRSI